MLGDRDYMRKSGCDDGSRCDPSGLYCVYALIIANVICFLMPESVQVSLVFRPKAFLEGDVAGIFTSLFVHASFWHVAFNMYSLYLFGSLVAPRLGASRFLALYFVSGLAGNAAFLALSMYNGGSTALLGASGAVMGVIIAAAMNVPDVKFMLLFVPFPMKLKTLAVVFIAIELFSQFTFSGGTNVAYIAHIGGFVGGFLFMLLFARRFVVWNPLASLFGGGGGRSKIPPSWTYHEPRGGRSDGAYTFKGTVPPRNVTQKELDALLDKISREGINSLSENELARLRLAREQMRGENNSGR